MTQNVRYLQRLFSIGYPCRPFVIISVKCSLLWPFVDWTQCEPAFVALAVKNNSKNFNDSLYSEFHWNSVFFLTPIECRRLKFRYRINFFSSIETSAKRQNEIKTKYRNEFSPNFCYFLAYRTYAVAAIKKSRIWQVGAKLFVISSFHSLKIHVHISFAHMKYNEVSLKLQLHGKLLQPRRRWRTGKLTWNIVHNNYILNIQMCVAYWSPTMEKINTDKHFSTFRSISKSIVYE